MLSTTLGYPQKAYLCAWAMHNRRAVHINHNVRSIEFLLSAEPLTFGRFGEEEAVNQPAYQALEITLSDQDVIETFLRVALRIARPAVPRRGRSTRRVRPQGA